MAGIFVLFDGYSEKLDDGTMKANCSCTLIKASRNIIVDTMTAWDREKLMQALDKHEVQPDEIDYVVCTHSHSDHIGNNNLFLNAEHVIGSCVHRGELFFENRFQNGRYEICPEVEVVKTPGHTADDVTVFFRLDADKLTIRFAVTGSLKRSTYLAFGPQSSWQIFFYRKASRFVAYTNAKENSVPGDLFEKEEDIMDPEIWKELGTEELRKTQSLMRSFVINKADYVIPGHGPMFKVTKEMREIVEKQVIR